MSEQNGAPAPSPILAPAAPVAPPPAAPAADPDAAPAVDPKWVASRLQRHEKQLFERFGVKDEADLKAALELRKTHEEAAKTTEQKRVEAEQQAKKLERQVTERDELLARLVESKLASLTEAQRSVIENLGGKDPVLRMSLIEQLTPTWAAQATPASNGAPAAPRPAQTAAPAPPAPAPGTPKTDFEKWTDLRASDPVAASLFYQMNSMRIEQSRRT